MTNAFPRQIANLITEDPDVLKETHRGAHRWQHEKQLEAEELEDAELLGPEMYFVKFTVGMDYQPGEPMVRYYSDGSGYPGSPDEMEWDILSIDEADAVDENGNDIETELTEELKEKLKAALYKHLNDEEIADWFENDLSGPEDDGDARYDEMRDRQRDEPDYY